MFWADAMAMPATSAAVLINNFFLAVLINNFFLMECSSRHGSCPADCLGPVGKTSRRGQRSDADTEFMQCVAVTFHSNLSRMVAD